MRRSQYALEFLMTYGWALLAITAIIGAIYAWGFTDISLFFREECEFYGQIECDEFSATSADERITIKIINDFNTDLQINDAHIDGDLGCTETRGGDDLSDPLDPLSQSWDVGEEVFIQWSGCSGNDFYDGALIDETINVTIQRPDGDREYTIAGNLKVKVD